MSTTTPELSASKQTSLSLVPDKTLVLGGHLYISLLREPQLTPGRSDQFNHIKKNLGPEMVAWLESRARKARLAERNSISRREPDWIDKQILKEKEELAQKLEDLRLANSYVEFEHESFEIGEESRDGEYLDQDEGEVKAILEALERIPEFDPAGKSRRLFGLQEVLVNKIEAFGMGFIGFEDDVILACMDEFPDFVPDEMNIDELPAEEKTTHEDISRSTIQEAVDKHIPNRAAEKAVKKQLPKDTATNVFDKQLPTVSTAKVVKKASPKSNTKQGAEKQIPKTTAIEASEKSVPKTTPKKAVEKQLPEITANKAYDKQLSSATRKKVLKAQLPKPSVKKQSPQANAQPVHQPLPKAIEENTVSKQLTEPTVPVARLSEPHEEDTPTKRRKTSPSKFVSVVIPDAQSQNNSKKASLPNLDNAAKPRLIIKSPQDAASRNSAAKVTRPNNPVAKTSEAHAPVDTEAQVSHIQTAQAQISQAFQNNPSSKLPATALPEEMETVSTRDQPQKPVNHPFVPPSEISKLPEIGPEPSPKGVQRLRINITNNKATSMSSEAPQDTQMISEPKKRLSKPLKSTHKAAATIKNELPEAVQYPVLQRAQTTTNAAKVPASAIYSWGESNDFSRSASFPTTGGKYTIPPPPRLPLDVPASFAVRPPTSSHRQQSGNFGHTAGPPLPHGPPPSHLPQRPQYPSSSAVFSPGGFPVQTTNFIGPAQPNIFNQPNRGRNNRADSSFTSPNRPNKTPTTPTTNHPSDRNAQYNNSPTPIRTPRGSLQRRGSSHTSSRNMGSPEINDTPIPLNLHSRFRPSRPSSSSLTRHAEPQPSSSTREVATVINFRTKKIRDNGIAMLRNKIATDAAYGELIIEPSPDDLTLRVSGPPLQNLKGRLAKHFGEKRVTISMRS